MPLRSGRQSTSRPPELNPLVEDLETLAVITTECLHPEVDISVENLPTSAMITSEYYHLLKIGTSHGGLCVVDWCVETTIISCLIYFLVSILS